MAADPLIARYLLTVGAELRGAPVDRERILAELEAHLEDAVDRLRAAGLDDEEAVRIALARCGSTAALLGAVHDNDMKGAVMATATRWTGLAGMLAAVLGVSAVMYWSPVLFVLTMACAAAAVVGLLARHWHAGPPLILGSVLVFGLANAAAALFPPDQHGLALGMLTPAGLVVLAALLLGSAVHRAAIIPRPATWLWLAGLAVAISANVAGDTGAIQNGATLMAVAGWVWMNAALALRPASAPPAPAPS